MASMSGVEVTKDRLNRLVYDMRYLTTNDVYVGIPSENAGRRETPISNAVIGYVLETGNPAKNLPARPFLVPAVQSIMDQMILMLRRAGLAQIEKGEAESKKYLMAMGLIAVNTVRKKMQTGPFAPLAIATLIARIHSGRGVKGAQKEFDRINAGGIREQYYLFGNIRPLIHTGQLRNAVTYVIRKRGSKS